jgi:hypothetical protein
MQSYLWGLVHVHTLNSCIMWVPQLSVLPPVVDFARVLTCVVCLLQVVLTAWQYHQGTQSNGVATYENSLLAAAYLSSAYPNLPSRSPSSLGACAGGTVSSFHVFTALFSKPCCASWAVQL